MPSFRFARPSKSELSWRLVCLTLVSCRAYDFLFVTQQDRDVFSELAHKYCSSIALKAWFILSSPGAYLRAFRGSDIDS